MSRIFNRVPAFAPDYSGAASVLHDMGGMIVYCGVGGCFGNYMAFDEPRLGLAKRIFTLGFRETHIVMGADEYAKEKIIESYRRVGGAFVALLGTPTSTMIGTDFRGLGAEIEKEIGVPVIFVETSGLYSYEKGQEETYNTLADYAEKSTFSEKADIHIIGATPLDAWDYGQKSEFMNLISCCGAGTPCIWGDENTIEVIGSLKTSRLNIAVSVSAVKTVKRLEKLYGTPYIIGFPVGRKALDRWECMLKGIPVQCGARQAAAKLSDKRILIVGEQIASNMLREMLHDEFGCKTADIITFFKAEKELLKGQDYAAAAESEFIELLKKREKYDIVIGDQFLTRAVPYEVQTIPVPSIAISGMVFMRQSPVLYGEKGTLYFQQILEGWAKGETTCA